ncbi:hypothetical protein GALL_444230 [mine drainage metagenome]|uniref:Uncharacterized protein n=1 Tax=mine drainage metagenome TaxID=410659 RepID=A0A1J5PR04_9ZZZZ
MHRKNESHRVGFKFFITNNRSGYLKTEDKTQQAIHQQLQKRSGQTNQFFFLKGGDEPVGFFPFKFSNKHKISYEKRKRNKKPKGLDRQSNMYMKKILQQIAYCWEHTSKLYKKKLFKLW